MAKARHGFTLVELLITIVIIGIMSSMVLFAMWQAQETAKEHRTRALITKLNSIVMRRFDEYRTRPVPFVFPAPIATGNTPPDLQRATAEIARARVDCLRDLMRMEMPDRWSDVTDNPVAPFQHPLATSLLPAYNGTLNRPAVSQGYYAKWSAGTPPSIENQGAECLYMIVMGSLAQEGDSRDFFKADDVGDIDNDGFPEFHDAWNQPIEFIRWAPGYLSPLQSPIRLDGAVTQDAPSQTATVYVTANLGPRLSQTPGSYVGGAIAFLRQNGTQIDFRKMGRITGYRYDTTTNPPTVTFTCSTPTALTDQQPFDGDQPTGEFVVLQPDPFDSRGAYPWYSGGSARPNPDTSVPTYAIYPLIISKGADRAMGVKDGAGGGSTLQYVNERLNPFFYADPVVTSDNYELMLGAIPSNVDSEPLWYAGCHLDNITNHQMSTR